MGKRAADLTCADKCNLWSGHVMVSDLGCISPQSLERFWLWCKGAALQRG
jgi:hypothetical protein